MEICEQYYRRVIASIGWTLVIFWGLMQAFGIFVTLLLFVLQELPIDTVFADVIYQLTYGAGYLATFMIPVVFLRMLLKKNGCRPQPMRVEPRVSPWLPVIVFAGLAVCFSASELNAALVSIFDYSSFSSEVLWGDHAELRGYEVILNFIVISIVPGFCEEFLFRGAILENCLPFGRTNAIVISSLLFAAMHQNIEQFFYTFVAGIVLGLIYERTGSIWNCTVLHILNNFVSVLQSAVHAKLGNTVEGNLTLMLIETVIFTLGAVSICILIVRFFSKGSAHRDGVFGKDIPASDAYALVPISSKRAVRLFCHPAMITFLALCAVDALTLLMMAVGGYY